MHELARIVGAGNVLVSGARMRRYTSGFRHGAGSATAVALPGSLVELWRVAGACARSRAIIIIQAANTGLTGGSTPFGDYDRPVVLISTERLGGVFPLGSGKEAICLAGSTLTQLSSAIAPHDRTPHSVIGSSCIGASVVGGVCNNSGGALVERGPAFTERALFAQIEADGSLRLVNRLGVELGNEPEGMLRNLEQGTWPAVAAANGNQGLATAYPDHVRQVNEPTPARYNADPRGLFEASGSSGKVIVFAVRLLTYPAPAREQTFLVGTDRTDALSALRRALLDPAVRLPTTCEYIHRDASRLAISHGNDVCILLRHFGANSMPRILALQKRCEALLGKRATDSLAQALGRIAPHPLPKRVRSLFERFEHVLVMTASDEAIEDVRGVLATRTAGHALTVIEAEGAEAAAALRVRFAVAGAMVRYRDVVRAAGDLAALDIALPRSAREFRLDLPAGLAAQVLVRADYGHFLCHVFHCDFMLAPGVARGRFEDEVKSLVEGLGGQMPAEHNFGHLYEAPEHVVAFYRSLDPTNSLNPGIGKTSRRKDWA